MGSRVAKYLYKYSSAANLKASIWPLGQIDGARVRTPYPHPCSVSMSKFRKPLNPPSCDPCEWACVRDKTG